MAARKGKNLHEFQGQHIYDGIKMGPIFPAHVLDRIKTFTPSSDDILIIGFPKSG